MAKDNANRQIKISENIHKEIKMLAAQEDREMREIVETAFRFYMEHKDEA